MGRKKETFGKKEVRNKQLKKRKDKEKRRQEKKELGKKSSFDEMIAWVDETGQISSTPPSHKIIPESETNNISTKNSAEKNTD